MDSRMMRCMELELCTCVSGCCVFYIATYSVFYHVCRSVDSVIIDKSKLWTPFTLKKYTVPQIARITPV
jgi:hypothetical protein